MTAEDEVKFHKNILRGMDEQLKRMTFERADQGRRFDLK